MVKAKIYITLKEQIADPQGEAVKNALEALGFAGVRGARTGKIITLLLDAENVEKACCDIDRMCGKILANPVIEDYRVEMENMSAEDS